MYRLFCDSRLFSLVHQALRVLDTLSRKVRTLRTDTLTADGLSIDLVRQYQACRLQWERITESFKVTRCDLVSTLLSMVINPRLDTAKGRPSEPKWLRASCMEVASASERGKWETKYVGALNAIRPT